MLIDLSKKNDCIEIINFPDGQQSIKINIEFDTNNPDREVTIKSRLNSFKDLELIICANQALLKLGFSKIHLYIPYFLGSRSDRQFFKGGVHYIKDVISPIINLQNFKTVTTIDPHSDVLEACIDRFKKQSNFPLVKFALSNIGTNNLVLISPDAGALKKIYDVAENFGIENIIVANKHRDIKTGKIVKTEINLDKTKDNKAFLIVDDICDGGRTFTELAKAIRNIRPKEEFNDKIYLVVTHGIFSQGFDELSKHFDLIFTTNSISDIENTLVKQFNI